MRLGEIELPVSPDPYGPPGILPAEIPLTTQIRDFVSSPLGIAFTALAFYAVFSTMKGR